jgi:hypothetical protein
MKAQEQGVARSATDYDEEYEHASEMIRSAREMTQVLMREGIIREVPEDGNEDWGKD